MPQLRESNRLKKLQNERAETVARMEAMLNEAGDNSFTEEQTGEYAKLEAELKATDTRIKREEEFLEAQSKSSRVIKSLAGDGQGDALDDVPPAGKLRIGRIHDNLRDDPKFGFKTPREFLTCVLNAGMGRRPDVRLEPLFDHGIGATAGSDEQQTQADQYGGYLVPQSFLPDFLRVEPEQDPLRGTTDLPMATPIVKIPARVDKNHQTSVTGGLQVTRREETGNIASTQMKTEQIELQAYALFGLAYATEEILVDSPISFAALLDQGFRDEMTAHMVDEKLNGTGVGQYLGIMKSPCLITVAEDSGPQAANTISITNVLNMRSRCWGYNKAVWIANHDTLPQIAKLALPNTSGPTAVLIFMPSAREDVPDILLGRPIFFTEYTQTLGTLGDIVLANMSQYLEGTYQPMNRAESVHVRFLNHERTFKFWLRNAGAPWWKTALTPKYSSNTLSPFVTLATRNGT